MTTSKRTPLSSSKCKLKLTKAKSWKCWWKMVMQKKLLFTWVNNNYGKKLRLVLTLHCKICPGWRDLVNFAWHFTYLLISARRLPVMGQRDQQQNEGPSEARRELVIRKHLIAFCELCKLKSNLCSEKCCHEKAIWNVEKREKVSKVQ